MCVYVLLTQKLQVKLALRQREELEEQVLSVLALLVQSTYIDEELEEQVLSVLALLVQKYKY